MLSNDYLKNIFYFTVSVNFTWLQAQKFGKSVSNLHFLEKGSGGLNRGGIG